MKDDKIAIIGMGCRFPDAKTIEQFWNNLCSGIDSVKNLTDEELRLAGIDEDLLKNPQYIKACGQLEGIENFDAAFFGYSPAEARLIDPQQRIFLEVAWAALENAGYAPRTFKEPVGVFAGSAPNKYFLYHLFGKTFPALDGHNWETDDFPVGTNPDALSARVSYKLGLTGPSITVQTACSSSLVAIALACDSLLDFRCNLALAGGVAIQLPYQSGYLYQEGGMLSKSGRCRSFDETADGSVFGSGSGIVVLKRLQDAIKDNDHIYAVIRGWAVRNDGINRAGYTAPGVEGQANVIVEAQVSAGLEPEDITYVETHGSATPVGDPIEIAALTHAFHRQSTALKGTCAIGSVKSNIGHLDAAAGAAGLIKTALSLKHRVLPKNLHFEKENPAINFADTPFFVQNTTAPWTSSKPLRAGVSSFGLGGTNAHIILEEAPTTTHASENLIPADELIVFPMSGTTAESTELLTESISTALTASSEPAYLANAAYTLAVGRTPLHYRNALILSADKKQKKIIKGQAEKFKQGVVFLFPGVGDQFQGSFRSLYERPGIFREEMQKIAKAFSRHLDIDLIQFLYSTENRSNTEKNSETINLRKMLQRETDQSDTALQNTTLAQPACFAIEYALARQLMAWGVTPAAFLGHSIGEYVAACLSGVISLDEAILLVASRASAIGKLPEGSMLAIPLSANELAPFLQDVFLSAVNGPKLSVVSGTKEAIHHLQLTLEKQDIISQKLRTTHPFHSELLRTAAIDLTKQWEKIHAGSPTIPYISNITGKWITAEQIHSPHYWGDHLCKTVQFVEGIRTLCNVKDLNIFLEVGPGQTLSVYAREIANNEQRNDLKVFHTGTSYFESTSDLAILMETLAKIWVNGGTLDWDIFYQKKSLNRVPLPTYPFNSKRHWVERSHQKIKPLETTPAFLDNSYPAERHPSAQTLLPLTANLVQGEPRPELGTPYVPPSNEIEQKLAAIWQGLFGYQEIGIHDDFVALGGHSLLALQFANKLWRLHKVEISIKSLLSYSTIAKLAKHLENNFHVQQNTEETSSKNDNNEITIAIIEKYLVKFFEQLWQRNLSINTELQEKEILDILPELIRALRRDFDFRLYPNEVVGHQTICQLATYLATELSRSNAPESTLIVKAKNQPTSSDPAPVTFILSAVRSGSTLLRVMLAGHPQLFCPPELHLLAYDTMKERAEKDKSPDQNQGLERALIELLNIDKIEANHQLQKMITDNLSTAEVLSFLIKTAAPRCLIEKSPGNSNNIQTLRRIKTAFPNAKFIYISRHPYAVIDSVVKNRFVKLMEGGSIDPVDFGEFVWSRSNGNILDFLESIHPSSFIHIKYEDLMADAMTTIKTLCHFLSIPFIPDLLNPYSGRRMRDGLGDPNFLDHDDIDKKLGEVWKKIKLPRPLNRNCRSLAAALNYEII